MRGNGRLFQRLLPASLLRYIKNHVDHRVQNIPQMHCLPDN